MADLRKQIDVNEPTPAEKACTKCDVVKSLTSNFGKSKRGKNGLDSWCKACRAAAARKWYAEKSREPGFREERKDQFARALKKWRDANSETVRAYAERYREENREAVAEGQRRYRQANPEKVREKNRRRRARLIDALVAPVDLAEIWVRDDGACQICMMAIDPSLVWPDQLSVTLDHEIPLSKGGTHEPDNVRLAHARCNSRKGDRLTADLIA